MNTNETPATLAPTPPTNARYYRFGLCGLTGGGKTCLLAALAMPRVAHPAGLTATLLPVTGDSAQLLNAGWQWVNEACEALRNGRVPPPNSLKQIENIESRLTLRYRFTDGNQHEAFVELVDYAGELLDPHTSQGDVAAQLRRYLDELDGFLFVAEHPRPGENSDNLAGYLLRLSQALALHQEKAHGRKNTPIALLVNKWDRSGPLARGTQAHAEESCKLDAFLKSEPPPPHAGLLSELVAASSVGCEAFPVSAFGEAVRESGGEPGVFLEKPANGATQLSSFGIVEPFLWLFKRRDHADADALTKASSRRWLWLNPFAALRCRKDIRRITARMSPSSPEIPRVRLALWRVKKCFIKQFVLLVVFWLCVELSFDAIGLRSARRAMTNPADATGWRRAESWFTGYIDAVPLLHVLHRQFCLSNAAAAAELQAARAKRDEQAWAAITASTDEATRVALTREYLANFPQGAHLDDARQLIADAEAKQARAKLRAQLQILSGRLESVREEVKQEEKNAVPDFKLADGKLAELAREAQAVAGLDVTDEALRKEHHAIIFGTNEERARIAGRIAAGESRKTYHAHVERGDWEQAGLYLSNLVPEEFRDLRDDFTTKVMAQVEAKSRKAVGNGAAWREGLAFVGKFRSTQMRTVMPEGSGKKLDTLEDWIKAEGDRELYSRCTTGGVAKTFTDYLDGAPLKTMEATASAWLHFLKLREARSIYRVGVAKITWGKGADGADSVTGNGETTISITVGAAHVKTTILTTRIGIWEDVWKSHEVELKDVIASEQQSIGVRIEDVDWPDGNDPLGSLVVSKRLDEIHGKTFGLKDSDHGENAVTFSVKVKDGDSWREFIAPALPPWTPKK